MVEIRTTKDEWDKFLFLGILCFLMRRNCIRDKLPLYELWKCSSLQVYKRWGWWWCHFHNHIIIILLFFSIFFTISYYLWPHNKIALYLLCSSVKIRWYLKIWRILKRTSIHTYRHTDIYILTTVHLLLVAWALTIIIYFSFILDIRYNRLCMILSFFLTS